MVIGEEGGREKIPGEKQVSFPKSPTERHNFSISTPFGGAIALYI